MASPITPELAGQLDAPTLAVTLALVELIERQQTIIDAVAEGLALLNMLDDTRKAEADSRHTLTLAICDALGIATAPTGDADRLAAALSNDRGSQRVGETSRQAYWDELAQLRAQRDGGGAESA